MSLLNIIKELENVLVKDPGMAKWCQDNFGRKLTVVRGDVPLAKIKTTKMPAVVIELGNGCISGSTFNGSQQVTSTVSANFLWYKRSYTMGFNQRAELLANVVAAFVKNPELNGTVESARVAKISPDRSVHYPKHRIEYEIEIKYRVSG